MSWRTIIISRRCKLDYKMGYMVIRGEEIQRVYLDEVAILVIENPAVSFTGCLMQALTEKKIKVIFCDHKHDPVAELVPHHGSHNSSERIRRQILWSQQIKDTVWQHIIRQKITAQAAFLQELKKEREYLLLSAYVLQVQPGDATNREGHAAKVYFNALFGMQFTRGADTPLNAALNYGYGLILSAVNRDICANGYLTQLGLFHNNMFNHFNLSCDLMEPFRVLIDRAVYAMQPKQFTSQEKHALWNVLNDTVTVDNRKQTVLNAIKVCNKSIFDALEHQDPSLIRFMQ